MNNYEVFSLFPWPLYKINIDREFTKQEHDEFDTIIEKHLEPKIPGAMFKRVSTDKYLLKRKPFASIQSFIDHHLKQFAAEIMGIFDPNVSLDITQSWLNATEPQQYFHNHAHWNSIISGVFYPKCLEFPGDKQDRIVFSNYEQNSIFGNLHIEKKHHNSFSGETYILPVVTGDLILFPSIMKHSIEKNDTTDQTRISLAFNTFFFGVLGEYGNSSELILKQEK